MLLNIPSFKNILTNTNCKYISFSGCTFYWWVSVDKATFFSPSTNLVRRPCMCPSTILSMNKIMLLFCIFPAALSLRITHLLKTVPSTSSSIFHAAQDSNVDELINWLRVVRLQSGYFFSETWPLSVNIVK